MQHLDESLWIKRFPLPVLGTDHGRTVTVMRLRSGKLIVHSRAPFFPSEVAEIRTLGDPSWPVEAMLLHDTYAREGSDHFPGIPFLGPDGFSEVVKFPTLPLLPAPAEWVDEIDVLELHGAPRLKEHVFVHKPSHLDRRRSHLQLSRGRARLESLLPPPHRRLQTLSWVEPYLPPVHLRPWCVPSFGGESFGGRLQPDYRWPRGHNREGRQSSSAPSLGGRQGAVDQRSQHAEARASLAYDRS